MPLDAPRQALMRLFQPAQTAERRLLHLARLEQMHDDRQDEKQGADQCKRCEEGHEECRFWKVTMKSPPFVTTVCRPFGCERFFGDFPTRGGWGGPEHRHHPYHRSEFSNAWSALGG